MLERIFMAAETVNSYGRTSRLAPGPSIGQGGAVVSIGGTLDTQAYHDIAAQVASGVANEDVRHIVLHFDSPGGMSKGCSACVDAIASAAAVKPLTSYVSGLCCSAAYWLASQTGGIYAERTSLAGSIGTYLVVLDSSKLAENVGLKFHVVKAGEFKGAASFGTEITADQLAEFQRLVGGLNEHFVAGVASGRKMSLDVVRALADGRVHLADDAVKLRLIDGVCSWSTLWSQITASQPVKLSSAETEWKALTAEQEAAGLSRYDAEVAVGMSRPFLRAQVASERRKQRQS